MANHSLSSVARIAAVMALALSLLLAAPAQAGGWHGGGGMGWHGGGGGWGGPGWGGLGWGGLGYGGLGYGGWGGYSAGFVRAW